MATRGQFNTKNPTIKRILKEASELASNPSQDFHAEPLEDNLFEWHFTLRGPPAPSPYEGGIYHGRIILPPAYPLRPPAFRFMTPTGRFEVNREICLSISGHHEETWQPAWGLRTAIVAIRSFMDTNAGGAVGSIECSAEARKQLAAQSVTFKCAACGRSNAEIIAETEEAAKLAEAKSGKKKAEEEVPEELRLAYRDELGKDESVPKETKTENPPKETQAESSQVEEKKPPTSITAPFASSPSTGLPPAGNIPSPRLPRTSAPPVQQPRRVVRAPMQQAIQNPNEVPMAWIDVGIYGVAAALLFMVIKKFF